MEMTESNFFKTGNKVFIGLLVILAILCLVGATKNPILLILAMFCVILAKSMSKNK